MTLKEKFVEADRYSIMKTTLADRCEVIADEFTIGFAEWFTSEKSEYSIMYGNQEKRFATFKNDYTAKELLEIYKKEKGL